MGCGDFMKGCGADDCEFYLEGFCVVQEYYPELKPCKGKPTNDDLVEDY